MFSILGKAVYVKGKDTFLQALSQKYSFKMVCLKDELLTTHFAMIQLKERQQDFEILILILWIQIKTSFLSQNQN